MLLFINLSQSRGCYLCEKQCKATQMAAKAVCVCDTFEQLRKCHSKAIDNAVASNYNFSYCLLQYILLSLFHICISA